MDEQVQIDDQQLVTALQKGTPGAFKELVERYQDRVINTCYRFLFNREDAQDLAQEVFIEVHRSIANFRGQSKISTWLYRIAVTRSIDFIRKSKRKKRFAPLKSIFAMEEEGKEISDDPSDNPEQNLEQSERMKVLQDAIAALPENQNIAFTLSKCDGMSNKNIAEIMSCSLPSVESLMHRAKKNLRKKLFHYFEKDLKRGSRFFTMLFFTWFFLFCTRLSDESVFGKKNVPQPQVFSLADVIYSEDGLTMRPTFSFIIGTRHMKPGTQFRINGAARLDHGPPVKTGQYGRRIERARGAA